jgi:predicted PurR-regulated permease PerM
VIATVIDAGLAVLLVAVSGFIIGGGPESLNNLSSTAAWGAALAFCFGAPVVGFILRRRGCPRAGATVALVPAMLGLILALGGL